jgi:hypothetical protein
MNSTLAPVASTTSSRRAKRNAFIDLFPLAG